MAFSFFFGGWVDRVCFETYKYLQSYLLEMHDIYWSWIGFEQEILVHGWVREQNLVPGWGFETEV